MVKPVTMTAAGESAATTPVLAGAGQTLSGTFEYPFAPHYLDLDGLRYHYVDEGSGVPVVMVHGNPSWSYLYRHLVLALRGTHRTIVPDHIGCGRSDKPSDATYEYTLERRIADLGRLIDSLGAEQIHLVVHDWGGMIGTAWAVDHPHRVASIVAMNTAAFHLPAARSMPFTLTLARTPGLGALLVRGLGAFSRGANRYGVVRMPMRPEVAAGFCEPYDSWHNRIAVHRFVQDIPLDPGHPAWERVTQTDQGLHRLRGIPLLLAWGMRDFVFDWHFLAEWERRFPHAESHRFADAGHYLLEDEGPAVIARIVAFLERTESGEGLLR